MSHIKEFLQDARGQFNAFTVVALMSGLMLVLTPLVCRYRAWAVLDRDEIGALTLLYCIAALGDALLGIYLNKLPSVVTQIGDQNNLGAANANSNDSTNPPIDATQIPHSVEPVSPGAV